MRTLEVTELGQLPYGHAWDLQKSLAERRKQNLVADQLLLLEHPHVLTLGRNGRQENILVSRERLAQLGIDYFEINRGGDITYHGPGQIVGYPILDLREWKRDVVAYVRSIEEVVIRALAHFGIEGTRDACATGVWTPQGKICAIGVHISRWVTTHGFALNWTTDLNYYQHIVPCGLTRPVTSMQKLGVDVPREQVHQALVWEFAHVFDYEPALQSASA
ncbi:MAG: lipoyl(octanoyl) transferase LipB [Acidobacteria bacterium]|nr:lipoyl(octanoyl) transferase LipB [Acidobacteriota bacterium]